MSDDLIARLEGASEGSRELDLQIALAIGLNAKQAAGQIAYVSYPHVDAPLLRYTESLDAALTLVPEGSISVFIRVIGHDENDNPRRPCAGVWHPDLSDIIASSGDCWPAATPALALCIAALKARAAR